MASSILETANQSIDAGLEAKAMRDLLAQKEQISPQDLYVYYATLARLQVRLGDPSNAKSSLEEIAKLTPPNPLEEGFMLLTQADYFRKTQQNALANELLLRLSTSPLLKTSPLFAGRYHHVQADMYYTLAQYENALTEYDLAISSFPKDHLEALQSLNNKSVTLQKLSRFEDARPILVDLLKTYNALQGDSSDKVAQTLLNLANLSVETGDRAAAEILQRQALEIFKTTSGLESEAALICMGNLASSYLAQDKWAMAEKLQREVLAIRTRKYGANHSSVALVLSNLASTLSKQGRKLEARNLHQSSLVIRRQALGEDHPDTAISANNYFTALSVGEQQALGPAMLISAIESIRKHMGPNHRTVAVFLGNLGIYYQEVGDYTNARNCFNEALDIFTKTKLGESAGAALIISNLANLSAREGNLDEALLLLKRSLSLRQAKLGAGHSEVAQSLRNLADAFLAKYRYTDAIATSKEAFEIATHAYPENSVQLNAYYITLIRSLLSVGHVSEAHSYFTKWRKGLGRPLYFLPWPLHRYLFKNPRFQKYL